MEGAHFNTRAPGCAYTFFVQEDIPVPFIISALLFLSLLVVTKIRGHIAGSSPLHTAVRACHFCGENISPLFFPRLASK